MIELNSLTCRFDRSVLDDVTLKIDTHLTILGANGSGKSTLAKAICNLIHYEGEIKIDSKNTKDLTLKQMASLIAYVPAKLESFDGYISVFEFVLLSRFAYKRAFGDYSKEDKKIAKDSIESLNISHLSEHCVSSLSSGESALVMIASALCAQSKIIIFDEPTANLDPQNSKIIASHIKELKKSHQVILITHDLHLACFVSSPVAFIKDKKLHYYEDGFFEDENLKDLYGVEFHSLAVVYA